MKRIIAEQEKDLTCLNEEKRYIQMRLMSLERSFDEEEEQFEDSQDFDMQKSNDVCTTTPNLPNGFIPHQSLSHLNAPSFSVPPPMATIPECDDCDEC